MTSSAGGVDVEHLDRGPPPGEVELDRGEADGPRPARQRERLPDSSTMTDAAPAVVAHAHDRGERAQRRPRGDRLAAAGQAERAGEGPRPRRRRRRRRARRWPAPARAGRRGPGSSRTPGGHARAADAGHGPARAPDRRLRAARRVGASAPTARPARRPAPRAADVVGPRAGQVGRAHLGPQRLGYAAARRGGAARRRARPRRSGGTSRPSTPSRTWSREGADRRWRAPAGRGAWPSRAFCEAVAVR